jgi:glycosyltransferase involved in cell wall biosynthesis
MDDLVSIIIPCYNAAPYVAEAIESALSQTYDPVEVIVIDDGSTDRSIEVIKSFDEHITWHSGENQGVSAARNRGIDVAEGEFVKFLDADDVLLEHSVETQVRQIRKAGEKKCSVFGDGQTIGPKGQVLGDSRFRRIRDDEDPIIYILNINPGAPFPLHRREHLVEIGGFDENLPWAEDYDLHLRLHLADVLLEYHPVTVVRVRQHGGENRLTNRKAEEYKENPWASYERRMDRERKIRQDCRGSLTDAVRRFLARSYWAGGRQSLKAGHPRVAQRYFERARELHSDHIVSPSNLYHWGVKLFGPRKTEKMVEWVRWMQRRVSAAA